MSLALFSSFLKAAFAVVGENTNAHTPTQQKIITDRDRYLPFRQLGPSKQVILGDPNSPFSPSRLKTRGGLFDALIFRLITQASPILVQEKQVYFGSPSKFKDATEGKEEKDYCNPMATGQHSRFRNITHISDYWEHTNQWEAHAADPNMTLESLLLWLTGREGKKTRFYGMGNLVGWLLASDYAYAGLIQMPEPSEVGEIIFKINAGGKSGLALLGFKVNTQEACAEAMTSVCDAVHVLLTPKEINEMGINSITLEHALCKLSRLKKWISEVGWHLFVTHAMPNLTSSLFKSRIPHLGLHIDVYGSGTTYVRGGGRLQHIVFSLVNLTMNPTIKICVPVIKTGIAIFKLTPH